MPTKQGVQPDYKTEKHFPTDTLVPSDPIAAKFVEWFPHRWDFIESPAKPVQWRTESRYPLEPRVLWRRHQDPESLIGVRFGQFTSYGGVDLDRRSLCHPLNDEQAFKQLLAAFASIGLTRPVIVQSSYSEGLHILFFLPKPVNTFDLACAMYQAVTAAGMTVRPGDIELFPNTKSYDSLYSPLRLPLQPESGSYLLDDDYQPYSDQISALVSAAEWAAEGQDMENLEDVLELSRDWYKTYKKGGYRGCSISKWRKDTEALIAEGWTGPGQTNDMLKEIGKYCRVFQRLEGTMLTQAMYETAIHCPGYQQFCRHTHEILTRCRHWAKIIEPYWTPLRSVPERVYSYAEMVGQGIKSQRGPRNEERQEEARNRIRRAYNHLKEQNSLPKSIKKLITSIIDTAKTLLGCGISERTLRRPENRPLWHPQYQSQPQEEEPTQQAAAQEEAQKEEPDIVPCPEQEAQDTPVSPDPQEPPVSTEEPAENPPTVLQEELQPEPSQEADDSFRATPPPVARKKGKNKENGKTPESAPCKHHSDPRSTPPIMKGLAPFPQGTNLIFVGEQVATGLVEKLGENYNHGTYETPGKLETIQPNTEVTICHEMKHSHYPDILYIKPAFGAENWCDAIAVSIDQLHLLQDGQPPQPISAWVTPQENRVDDS
jgi:hypothetical protein